MEDMCLCSEVLDAYSQLVPMLKVGAVRNVSALRVEEGGCESTAWTDGGRMCTQLDQADLAAESVRACQRDAQMTLLSRP